jgi:hypothetical protein
MIIRVRKNSFVFHKRAGPEVIKKIVEGLSLSIRNLDINNNIKHACLGCWQKNNSFINSSILSSLQTSKLLFVILEFKKIKELLFLIHEPSLNPSSKNFFWGF